jgi:hypothetical protein
MEIEKILAEIKCKETERVVFLRRRLAEAREKYHAIEQLVEEAETELLRLAMAEGWL